MTDLTPEEVARLAAAATPGPWKVSRNQLHFDAATDICCATEPQPIIGAHDEPTTAFVAAAHDMAALIAEQAKRIAEFEQRAEPVAWLGPYQTAAEALDELRKACALIIEADPETWPSNGNAPLAIAAVLARWRHQALNAAPPAPSVPDDAQIDATMRVIGEAVECHAKYYGLPTYGDWPEFYRLEIRAMLATIPEPKP